MEESTIVFDRAMQWLDDLQNGTVESAALFRWLAESPRHVEEFLFALTLRDEIKGLTNEQCAEIEAMRDRPSQPETVVSLSPSFGPGIPSIAGERVARRRTMRFMIAASLVACSALLVALAFWWDSGWRTYRTDFGEQRVVELSDGSILHLNTESRVKVKFGTARDVRLVSGEALFKVKRDPMRPFRVHAGGSVIQAVGTQFNVYRNAAGTTVAVLEGSVRITPEAEPSIALSASSETAHGDTVAERLGVGQEAHIGARGRVETRNIDVAQAAAWRQRRLVFRNETLAEIATQFNRYNRRPQIRIADERAGALRFAATFDADAPEALMQVLQTNAGVRVERDQDVIVIRSRPIGEFDFSKPEPLRSPQSPGG
jgi:transmembrane sensor